MGVPLWKTVYLDSDLSPSVDEDDEEEPGESFGYIVSEDQLRDCDIEDIKGDYSQASGSGEPIEEVDLTLDEDSVEFVYEETRGDDMIEFIRSDSQERARKPVGSFFLDYIGPHNEKPRYKNKRGGPPSILTNQKKFKCPMCEVYFTRKNNIKSHLRIHTGEKPYSCVECGKSFTRKDTFNRHSCKCKLYSDFLLI